MSKRVAEIVIDTLQQAGVRRCYGIVGDTLNHVTDAMHRSDIEWVHVRHEEVAAFAAKLDASREAQRAVLGFLYSTPAYRRTLELFGWDDLGAQLQLMTRSGDWSQLGMLMTDEVLDVLIPSGTWEELPTVINDWFAGLVDAVLIQPSDGYNDEFAALISQVKLIKSRINAA